MGPPEIEAEQMRYAIALGFIAKGFKALGVGDHSATKIMALSRAFHDLTKGIKNPVFLPASRGKGGRSQERQEIWAARRVAALGLEMLVRSGVDVKEAATLANNHPGLRRLCQGNQTKTRVNIADAVISWRKGYLAQQVMDEIEAEVFSEQKSRLTDAAVTNLQKREAGIQLFRIAAKQAKAMPAAD